MDNEETASDLNISQKVTARMSYHAMAAFALGKLIRHTLATSRKHYLVFARDVPLVNGIAVVGDLQWTFTSLCTFATKRVERPSQGLCLWCCANRTLQFIFITYRHDSGCLEKSHQKKRSGRASTTPSVTNTFCEVHKTPLFPFL